MTPSQTETAHHTTDLATAPDGEMPLEEDFPEDGSTPAESAVHDEEAAARPKRLRRKPPTLVLVWVVILVLLSTLVGWLGWQSHKSDTSIERQAELLQVSTQTAVNLTTIDFAQAEADVQRILKTSTGRFRDEFSQNSAEFVDTVKKSQAKSTGTISAAGIESATDNAAKVLVAVKVITAEGDTPPRQPRYWRMRISAQFDANEAKVSNVEFVP